MTQFITFIRCALLGIISAGISGIVLFPIFSLKGKRPVFMAVGDALTFFLLPLMFIVCSVLCDFGGLRGYMIAGMLFGIVIYKKSFQISLDFCSRTVYNNIREIIKNRKKLKSIPKHNG